MGTAVVLLVCAIGALWAFGTSDRGNQAALRTVVTDLGVHSVAVAPNGELLVVATEDFTTHAIAFDDQDRRTLTSGDVIGLAALGEDLMVVKRPDEPQLVLHRFTPDGVLTETTSVPTPPELGIEFGVTVDSTGARVAFIAVDRSLGEEVPSAAAFVTDIADGATHRLDPPATTGGVENVRFTPAGVLVVTRDRAFGGGEAWLSPDRVSWELIAGSDALLDVAFSDGEWLVAESAGSGWDLRCGEYDGGGEVMASSQHRLSADGIAANDTGRVVAAELTEALSQLTVFDLSPAETCES